MTETTSDPLKQQPRNLMRWLVSRGADAGLRGWAYGMTLPQVWAAGCGGGISARWILDQLCADGLITRRRAIRLDAKHRRREFVGDDMRGIDLAGKVRPCCPSKLTLKGIDDGE